MATQYRSLSSIARVIAAEFELSNTSRPCDHHANQTHSRADGALVPKGREEK